MIGFQKNGTKPDGKIKWKITNPDGSEHQHKTKPEERLAQLPMTPEQQRAADIQRLYSENMAASKALTDAIIRLASTLDRCIMAVNAQENKSRGGELRQ
jgi:hypothetical protein